MAEPLIDNRTAPRRGTFSLYALFSVIALGLLTISVLSSNQRPAVPATTFEQVGDVDFDDAQQVTKLLISKLRDTAVGDQYL